MSASANQTDQQLLHALQQGDTEAFSSLFNLYSPRMLDYVAKVIRSEEDAKDIVQEIFTAIWRRRETLTIQGPIIAYLMGATRNLAIRYIEKNIHAHSFLDSLIQKTEGLTPPTFADYELKELEDQIETAIARLPEKMRNIFFLSRYENLSYLEIASQLNISDTTVKKQISNALKRIRKDIKDDHIFSIFLLGAILQRTDF